MLTLREGGCIVASPPAIDLNLVMEKFNNDKKHLSDVYRMVCPRGDGELELVSEAKNDDVHRDIAGAYESALKEIGWQVVAAAGMKAVPGAGAFVPVVSEQT